MPEGDSVWQTAQRLHAALAGKTLTRFELRVPQAATVDLSGQVVREVVPRGKHLLLRAGAFTLHSHLKMEGRWDVHPPGTRWRRPAHTARAILAAAGVEAVGFDIAEVRLVPTADEHTLVGHLGPDPLQPDWDPTTAAANLSADRRAIHVALLDQRHIAGLGNEYASEVLFIRGILPTTPASQIDAAALVDTAARMLRANRDRVPRTFTGDTRRGRTTWVYRRERQPCLRCSTPIRAASLGADPTRERAVFWCPVCQR
ncbi:Fpg/Nei family DNA glycosylase [Microbacterium protaetiae]|uniref:DNA-(apurinic or apyrimidinic site) lyase n=1 Tax=Microbacterium protaetiae TaxID=2509458 RepID=A0A4P6EG82_9MICO|nr:DNA-formamidopyrimidine glycosylase family protein [Microbacterium protaetiae]QAY60169.1 Fpg/Nei family DNA glycosylase [Microbacterium protaetiae]